MNKLLVPIVIYFGLIPLTLIAAVFTAASAWSRWRGHRRQPVQAIPLYAQPAPQVQQPTVVYVEPALQAPAAGLPPCRCGAPVVLVVDSATLQPSALRCTDPGCRREAPVGPWGAFQEHS